MTTTPKNFRLSDRNVRWINRYGVDVNASAQIREDIEALEGLVHLGHIEVADIGLDPDSAALIVDAFVSHAFSSVDFRSQCSCIIYQVEDAIKLEHLDQKWAVDKAVLISKLGELSSLGAVAIIHMVRLYLAKNAGGQSMSIAEIFPI